MLVFTFASLHFDPAASSFPDSTALVSHVVEVSKSPLSIVGLSYQVSDENRLQKTLVAESFEIRPRRFIGFNVKSLNEAVLRNAHVASYSYTYAPLIDETLSDGVYSQDTALDTSFKDLHEVIPFIGGGGDSAATARVFGRITRLIFHTPVFEYFRDGAKAMSLVAATGLVEKNRKGAKFFNARLHDFRSNRVLTAREILWDSKRKVFVIPGTYGDRNLSGTSAGSSIEVDMDFLITPLTL